MPIHLAMQSRTCLALPTLLSLSSFRGPKRVSVYFDSATLAAIDQARGPLSRSEEIRRRCARQAKGKSTTSTTP